MMKNTMSNSLFQVLLKNEKEAGNRIYLRQPRDGVWHEFTWAEVMQQARKVAGFLKNSGLKKGDHVSIISKNCAEWFITDFGIQLAGMVNIPLFTNQNIENTHYVLEHGNVKLVFVGKLDDPQVVRKFIPNDYPTVSFDYHDNLKVTHTWSEVLATEPLMELTEPGPEDLYTIIYSSGTTGSPKGAMYTNQTIANYLTVFPIDLLRVRKLDHYKLVSYLPLAHVYERTAVQLGSVTMNCSVSFLESMEKFADNLKEIQPTFFTAVPRIWNVFQQKIEQKLPSGKLNFLLKIPLVSGLIKKKIVHGLGFTDCTNCFSGASHLPLANMQFFEKLGILIQEGYGQSENLAYATLSLLDDRKHDSVGIPRLEVKIKVAKDGELLVKSPCLMSGYYKNKKATEDSFTADGWLRTGDIAEIDSKQRVKILGRVSENFKNHTGEFVAPSPIEKKFAVNKMIDQMCVVGRDLPSNVLVVTLAEGLRLKKKEEEINSSLTESLRKVNAKLLKHEKISHIIVVKEAWNSDNNMLTPTLKVKRKVVEQHYADIVQKSLTGHELIAWEL